MTTMRRGRQDGGPYPEWNGRPARSLRYGPLARLADIRRGRHDGRKGIPELPAVEPDGPIDQWTATVSGLRKAAQERRAHEDETLVADCSRLTETAGRIEKELPGKRLALKAAERKLARIKPIDVRGEVERRLAEGNLAQRPEQLVRQRRGKEYVRQIADAEQGLEQATRALAHLEKALDTLKEQIRLRRGLTEQRNRRVTQYTERRVAAYWRSVLLHHPEGPRLNAILRFAEPAKPCLTEDPPEIEGES